MNGSKTGGRMELKLMFVITNTNQKRIMLTDV